MNGKDIVNVIVKSNTKTNTNIELSWNYLNLISCVNEETISDLAIQDINWVRLRPGLALIRDYLDRSNE